MSELYKDSELGLSETGVENYPKDTTITTPKADKFDETLIGDYTVSTALNCRAGAGIKNKSLCVLPKGTKVKCDGHYRVSAGVKWLHINTKLKGSDYTGYSCIKYLTK